jgi:hypothetical protein
MFIVKFKNNLIYVFMVINFCIEIYVLIKMLDYLKINKYDIINMIIC